MDQDYKQCSIDLVSSVINLAYLEPDTAKELVFNIDYLHSMQTTLKEKSSMIRQDYDPEHYAFSYGLYGEGPDKEDDSNG